MRGCRCIQTVHQQDSASYKGAVLPSRQTMVTYLSRLRPRRHQRILDPSSNACGIWRAACLDDIGLIVNFDVWEQA